MDFWQKARSFAEGAAKRSQELTTEAAKGIGSMTTEAAKGIGSTTFSDVVSEASKRSKEIAAEASKRSREIAAEASKRADQIKIEAIKRADQIKSQIPAAALSHLVDTSTASSIDTVPTAEDLVKYGVTEELMEFVKGITINTFKDFPLEDDSEMSDVPTESNVRRDLTEWQERHAKLVLSTVKEISKLRYELCPRWMKERKFWRIYFILVNSHVAPCEKRYMEEAKQKCEEKKVQENVEKEGSSVKDVTKTKVEGSNEKSKSGNKSASEQDLDVFLLGDTGDSDGVPGDDDDNDDNDDGFDDDEFDKL